MKARRNLLLATTALTPLLIIAGGEAAQAQAVSAPNATFGGFGGQWSGLALGAGELRLTAPLTPVWGAQFDGVIGTIGGSTWGEAAGHVFARDPTLGLFGLYGAWTTVGSNSNFRAGPEFELYASNATLSAVAGWKSSGVNNYFAQMKASFYITPNDKWFLGYVNEDGQFATSGFEHQFAGTGVSAFGEARVGTNSSAAWAGIRVYFGSPGAPKTLIQREREDVAPLWLWVADSANPGTTPGAGTTAGGSSTPAPTTTVTASTSPAPSTPAPTTTPFIIP